MTKNVKGYTVPDGVTVDIIIYNELGDILTIRRGKDPFVDLMALPGGHIDEGEDAYDAIVREVKEETNLTIEHPILLSVYSSLDRDPRGWYISNLFYAYVSDEEMMEAKAGDDANAICFIDHNQTILPTMAFDHADMIRDFRRKMANDRLL